VQDHVGSWGHSRPVRRMLCDPLHIPEKSDAPVGLRYSTGLRETGRRDSAAGQPSTQKLMQPRREIARRLTRQIAVYTISRCRHLPSHIPRVSGVNAFRKVRPHSVWAFIVVLLCATPCYRGNAQQRDLGRSPTTNRSIDGALDAAPLNNGPSRRVNDKTILFIK
jgi:hypothetical protein